jgi:hypothetical protein
MDTTIQIITGVLETGVIGFVVYLIIKGLKTEVKSLQNQINIQHETIRTMDKRIEETEKIGDLYKKMISDFPQALEDYQTVIIKTKDRTIYELQSKVDEQENLIAELKTVSEQADIKVSKRTAIVGKLLLEKDNRDLLKFINSLDSNKEKIYRAIFKHEKFDDFIGELIKEIKEIDESDANKIMNTESFKKFKARFMMRSLEGSYMVTFDNKLYITKFPLKSYRERYEALK